jgi:anti-sigma regulatory factor (Ser/Thr protein kinase)
VEVSPQAVPVAERSAVGEVRRRAVAIAGSAGFDEQAVGRVAIVATELATNVVKHACQGYCLLSLDTTGSAPLVQIVAVDAGSGIDDPGRALRDGYSTAGTPGNGLGAVQRLSRSFDLYTRSADGVVAVARIGPDRPADASPAAALEVGAIEAPLQGEPVSGDGWALERTGETLSLLVSDGLGHGVSAAEASAVAITAFRAHPGARPLDRVERIHEAMRSTRGAAVAVVHLDAAARSARFAGIGNISAQIISAAGSQSLVSMNGTAGHVARTFREFSYDLPPGGLIVIHSDGVSARFTLDAYPGIFTRDPAVVAALLHRDFGRRRDDATVVVARLVGASAFGGAEAE